MADELDLLKIDGEPIGVARPIKWSAREIVGIGIIDTKRIQKDEDGNTVLVPTDHFIPTEKGCEREWDNDGWWCINDRTGCLYNDGHNTCTAEGDSLRPLER